MNLLTSKWLRISVATPSALNKPFLSSSWSRLSCTKTLSHRRTMRLFSELSKDSWGKLRKSYLDCSRTTSTIWTMWLTKWTPKAKLLLNSQQTKRPRRSRKLLKNPRFMVTKKTKNLMIKMKSQLRDPTARKLRMWTLDKLDRRESRTVLRRRKKCHQRLKPKIRSLTKKPKLINRKPKMIRLKNRRRLNEAPESQLSLYYWIYWLTLIKLPT